MSAAGAVARASASARAPRAPPSPPRPRVSGSDREASARPPSRPPPPADLVARAPCSSLGRGRGRANRTVTSAALGLNPAAVGCLFDSPVGAILASALGGVITSLAERLWSKRHSTPLTITHADTPSNRALLAACPHFHGDYDAVDALRNRHACTIATSLLRQNLAVEYQREVLRMRDGGHVTLDWPISVPEFEPRNLRHLPPPRPPPPIRRRIRRRRPRPPAPTRRSSAAVGFALRVLRRRRRGRRTVFPGVIGVAGGGGADGCGSGGGGCDVDAAAPSRRPTAAPSPIREDDARAALAERWRCALPDDAPVLVLMSGIAGGSHDKYLKHFLRRAHLAGYRCVAFNCRGTSDSPLTTPRNFTARPSPGDVRAVVDELAGRWPDASLFAVGWSLGANILTNFLGEEGRRANSRARWRCATL